MNELKKQTRLAELDALRGLAALSVVFYHFTTWYNNKFIMHIHPLFSFWFGYCGVHLFFMISGFVIFMTLEKTAKPFDFIVSRFSRLYPAYWAVILFNLILISPIDPRQFILNATMLSPWLHSKYVCGAFWTLSVELAFYICILFLFITRTLKYIEIWGWLSLKIPVNSV